MITIYKDKLIELKDEYCKNGCENCKRNNDRNCIVSLVVELIEHNSEVASSFEIWGRKPIIKDNKS